MDVPVPVVRKFKPLIRNTGDEYTIPRIRYKYQRVSWDIFMGNKNLAESNQNSYKTIRSSFIPYTIVNDQKYWVLGSFHDFPDILMDFGGSCILFDPPIRNMRPERNYQHSFGCAMLELYEESKGLLVKPVLEALSGNDVIIYRGSDDRNREYVWFIIVLLKYEDVTTVLQKFPETSYVSNELLGDLGIYKSTDLLKKTYRTSRNLTDFIDYLNTSL